MPSSKLTGRFCGAVVFAAVPVFFLLLCAPDPAREGVSRIPFMPMAVRTSPERSAKITQILGKPLVRPVRPEKV